MYTEGRSQSQARSRAVRLERQYTSGRGDRRFRGGGPALPRGKRTIRSVLNGHVPRLNRVEPQICRALGLDIYLGPPRDVQVEADGAEPSRPLTRFNLERPTAGSRVVTAVAGGHLAEGEEADQTRARRRWIWTTRRRSTRCCMATRWSRPASGRRTSASSLHARSSNPASGSGSGNGRQDSRLGRTVLVSERFGVSGSIFGGPRNRCQLLRAHDRQAVCGSAAATPGPTSRAWRPSDHVPDPASDGPSISSSTTRWQPTHDRRYAVCGPTSRAVGRS